MQLFYFVIEVSILFANSLVVCHEVWSSRTSKPLSLTSIDRLSSSLSCNSLSTNRNLGNQFLIHVYIFLSSYIFLSYQLIISSLQISFSANISFRLVIFKHFQAWNLIQLKVLQELQAFTYCCLLLFELIFVHFRIIILSRFFHWFMQPLQTSV